MSSSFIYEKVYIDIKEKILNGTYKENYKLTSIRNLSTSAGISKNSVIHAYELLEIEGLIYSDYRNGYFVSRIDPLNKSIKNMDSHEKDIHEALPLKYDFSFSGVGNKYFDYKNLGLSFKNTINSKDMDIISQDDPKGSYNLRYSIKKHLSAARNIHIDEDQIIIAPGSYELLMIVRLIFPNKVFGFENPSYQYTSNSIFINIDNLPMDISTNGVIVRNIDRRIDLPVVTPARQFPLTYFMDYHTRVSLLNWANEKDSRYIIENDYDAEFKYKLDKIYPLMAMDINDKVIYFGNFSRTISPAVRISYMVLPKHIVREHDDKLQILRCSVSNFVQEAVSYFIDRGYFEKQVNRMRVLYSRKYDFIMEKLKDSNYIKILSTNPGISFVIETIPVDNTILIKNLREKGVKIKPINGYTYDKKGYENKFLIGFAKLDFKQIDKGLDIIIQEVKKLS